jgi:hypothetical protein
MAEKKEHGPIVKGCAIIVLVIVGVLAVALVFGLVNVLFSFGAYLRGL